MTVEIWGAKTKSPVELDMANGTVRKGSVYLASNERVLDAVNGEKPFFPFFDEEGRFRIVAKAEVAAITPLDEGGRMAVHTRLERLRVEITERGGTLRKGNLLTPERTRPLDVVNGSRRFIPFENETGDFQVLNTTAFADVRPIED